MKNALMASTAALGLLFFAAHAPAMDPDLVSARVQADLEASLARIIPAGSFLVQASARVATVSERKVLEGEIVSESRPPAKETPPALPGFSLPPQPPERPVAPIQTKQIYKTIEREVLKSLSVQVTLDQALAADQIADARALVRKYLTTAYGDKAAASFAVHKMLSAAPMLAETPSLASWQKANQSAVLPWGIALVFGLACLAMTLGRRQRSTRSCREPAPAPSKEAQRPLLQAPALVAHRHDSPTESTNAFFDAILETPSVFRLYYLRQNQRAQAELCGMFQGAAFDSLLETLGLAAPKAEPVASPDPERIVTQLKHFRDFARAQLWQNEQFFGFLHSLTDDELVSLIKRERPLNAAVALRQLKAQRSALILQRLKASERLEVFRHSSAASDLAPLEVTAIERLLRESVSKVPPKGLATSASKDLEFWEEILSHSDNPAILAELKSLRPDLYDGLSKRVLSFSQLTEVKPEALSAALGEVENSELAVAITGASAPVREALLAALPTKRRELIIQEAQAQRDAPLERVSAAQRSLTQRIKEAAPI